MGGGRGGTASIPAGFIGPRIEADIGKKGKDKIGRSIGLIMGKYGYSSSENTTNWEKYVHVHSKVTNRGEQRCCCPKLVQYLSMRMSMLMTLDKTMI